MDPLYESLDPKSSGSSSKGRLRAQSIKSISQMSDHIRTPRGILLPRKISSGVTRDLKKVSLARRKE